jgi:RNA polymerase sigma-70 factor (ECF subfamily)
MEPRAKTEPRGDDPFGSTHWSVVLAAGQEGSAARSALEELCRAYWIPVYAYVRRRTSNPHDAEELTQGFFTDLLERNSIAAADPARGRFRAFLLTALKHYLANEHEKATAQKRGRGQPFFSLNGADAEPLLQRSADGFRTPEQEFERRWALALLDRVIDRLEREQVEAGRREQFETLRLFLTGQSAESSMAAVAPRLGLSPDAVRAAVTRLRKRYRALLREEIARTVSGPDDVDDELRRLSEAVGS